MQQQFNACHASALNMRTYVTKKRGHVHVTAHRCKCAGVRASEQAMHPRQNKGQAANLRMVWLRWWRRSSGSCVAVSSTSAALRAVSGDGTLLCPLPVARASPVAPSLALPTPSAAPSSAAPSTLLLAADPCVSLCAASAFALPLKLGSSRAGRSGALVGYRGMSKRCASARFTCSAAVCAAM